MHIPDRFWWMERITRKLLTNIWDSWPKAVHPVWWLSWCLTCCLCPVSYLRKTVPLAGFLSRRFQSINNQRGLSESESVMTHTDIPLYILDLVWRELQGLILFAHLGLTNLLMTTFQLTCCELWRKYRIVMISWSFSIC